MRKLERGPAPACLSLYRHGLHNWRDLTAEDKQHIWEKIDAMQQERCAYCEGPLHYGKRHLEHFRQKGRDPRVTFRWSNLFGSCNQTDSCGRHKDELGVYEAADLIKPDEEDPEQFFLFVSDGSIAVREALNAAQKKRASETIRIFNLNGVLRARRYSALAGFVSQALEVQEMVDTGDFTLQQARDFLKDELAAVEYLPFSTAIRHILMPV